MVRRIHSIVLLFVLLIGGAGMNYVQAAKLTGTCGAPGNEANVTWELDTENGILDINGTGAMTHYWSLPDIPWYNYRQYVTAIFVSTGVTTVGHHAFYDFPNVKSIYLYSTLTSIGVLSFGFCRKVTSLEIPNSVTSIGDQALWYNESLRDVYVSWTGDAVPAMPSNIHNFEASQIRLHIPCGQEAVYTAKGWNTKFTFQSASDAHVINSSTGCFPWSLSCDSVLTVSGTGAMNDFPEPQYLIIANLRFIVNSPALSPFFGKQKVIKEAVFEEGITYIGNNTFHKNQYRTGYTNFTTLTLPSTLTNMSSTAFTGCIALKDVYVSWTTAAAIPTWNQSIDVSQTTLHVPCGTTAFYQAKGWQNFIIKEERGHGTCGAEGKNLTWTLSCDGTLTISGTGAMKNYPNPVYHTVAGIPFVANRSSLSPFWGMMEEIKEAVFEEGITYIGNNTFYRDQDWTGYHDLTTLTLPSTLTSMSSTAFKGCVALKDVYVSWTTAAAIPTWNQSIDVSQATLHVPCSTTAFYQAKGWQNYTIVEDDRAHGTCGADGDNLTWNLCDGTLTISGSGAMRHFWDYAADIPWWNYRGSIQRIVIEEGVTTIGNHAFVTCSALTSVYLPNTLTAISYLAFGHCLQTLTADNAERMDLQAQPVSGCYQVLVQNGEQRTVLRYIVVQ